MVKLLAYVFTFWALIKNFLTSPCNAINDCFNCTMFSSLRTSCTWNLGSCEEAKTLKHWWLYFTPCVTDDDSYDRMQSYCGKVLEKPIPLIAQLINNNEVYGMTNLYCRWEVFNPNSQQHVLINFTKYLPDLHDQYAIEVVYYQGKTVVDYLQTKSFEFSAPFIESIYLHYFTSQPKSSLPFRMSFTELVKDPINYLGLFVSLGVIIFACIICSALLYKCSKLFARRRRGLRMDPEFQAQEGVQINSRPLNPDEDLIGQNYKLLQSLLENELKPYKYKKDPNENDGVCTICLENLDSDVIRLFCKHLFHYKCLMEWCDKVMTHPKCPNCNEDILHKKHQPETMILKENAENINTLTERRRLESNPIEEENKQSDERETIPRVEPVFFRNRRSSQRVSQGELSITNIPSNTLGDQTVINNSLNRQAVNNNYLEEDSNHLMDN